MPRDNFTSSSVIDGGGSYAKTKTDEHSLNVPNVLRPKMFRFCFGLQKGSPEKLFDVRKTVNDETCCHLRTFDIISESI